MSRTKFFSGKGSTILAGITVFCAMLMFSGCGDDGDNNNPGNQGGGGGGGGSGSQFNPNINYGSFTDTRDSKKYRTVVIGTQTWMAENLNYNAPGSKCYGEDGEINIPGDEGNTSVTLSNAEVQANCAKYGRLYDWETVMDGATSSLASPSGVQGVCPVGWHIPSDEEWMTLVMFVDPDAMRGIAIGNNAGTKLKSKSGWNDNGNGTDEFGFSALPGGSGEPGGSFFYNAGYDGFWWSATAGDPTWAWRRNVNYENDYVGRFDRRKTYLYSVRCVRDN